MDFASLCVRFTTAFTPVPLLSVRFIPVKSILYHVLTPAVGTGYTVHSHPHNPNGMHGISILFIHN